MVSRLRFTSLGLGLEGWSFGLGLGLAGWSMGLGLEPLGLDYNPRLLKNGVENLRSYNICWCFRCSVIK